MCLEERVDDDVSGLEADSWLHYQQGGGGLFFV